jgi:drug/metabolite transporter (DMT)-like permease
MIYVLVLTAVTAVWGWTFVLVKDAISQYPVAPFLALRFALAVAVMLPIARRLPGRRALRAGGIIGVAVALGYALQTYGMQDTSPGIAGLITGLFVVFTPLIDHLFGARIPPRTVAAVAIALLGTALLAGTGGGPVVSAGDLLVLAGALFFALQIVLLSRLGPGLSAADLATVQMAVCFVVFSAAGSTSFRAPAGIVWFAVVITGVFASALAFFLQAWAQKNLSATRAALIMAMEPAWALFFAVILTGERLSAAQGVGAALVLLAVAGHEALPLLGGGGGGGGGGGVGAGGGGGGGGSAANPGPVRSLAGGRRRPRPGRHTRGLQR